MAAARVRSRAAWLLLDVALIALLGYGLVQLSYALLLDPPINDYTVASPVATSAFTARATLVGLNLFGAPPPPPQIDDFAAPPTELKLRLVGTFDDAEGEQGNAIIADTTGRQARYQVGEILPEGALVLKIQRGKVLLEYRGRRELLALDPEREARLASAVPGQPAAASALGADAAFVPVVTPLNFGRMSGISMDLPATLPPSAAQRIETLARNLRPVPVVEDGRTVGFRLDSANPTALVQFGLEPGDLVTAINGQDLSDPTRAISALQALSQAESAQLTVRRGSATQQITVRLR